MKMIIAGGRKYTFTKSDVAFLDKLHKTSPITEVVCGMAAGADLSGRMWALSRDIPIKEFPAEWDTYGKSAGIIRNTQMAAYADGLIAFPGGTGTDNMLAQAREKGLLVFQRLPSHNEENT